MTLPTSTASRMAPDAKSERGLTSRGTSGLQAMGTEVREASDHQGKVILLFKARTVHRSGAG
jgi:hypothetical protein